MRRAQFDEASQLVRNIAGNPKLETTAGTTTIRTNLASNPSFEAASAVTTTRTNLATNPSFEATTGVGTVRTNLVLNPSMETGSSTAVTRTNLAVNPNATTATGWFIANGMTASGAANQPAGPIYNNTFYRMTTTATGTGMGYFAVAYGQPGAGNGAAVVAGTTYTLSAFVRVTMTGFSVQPQIRLRWKDAAGATLGDLVGTATGATSGSWTRIGVSGTAPANAAYIEAMGGYQSIDLATIPIGSTVDMSGVLVEATNGIGNYFDGTIPAGQNIAKYGTSGLGQGGSVTLTTGVAYSGSAWTRAAVAAGTGSGNARAIMDLVDLVPGQTYTSAVTVANDQAFSQVFVMDWNDGASTSVTLAPGEQRRVVLKGSRSVYDATYRFLDLQVNQSASEGRSVLFKDLIIELGDTLGDFYPVGTGDYTYAWTGTANASSSVQRATGINNWALASLAAVAQSSNQKYSQGKSMLVSTKGGNGDGFYHNDISGIVVGASYTFSAWVKTTSSHPLSISFRWKDAAVGTLSDSIVAVSPSTVVGVWTRVSATAVAPPNAAIVQPMMRIFAAHTATVFYVDDVLIERASGLGSYFDGATPAAGDFTYAWSGTANASLSYQQAPTISSWTNRWYGNGGGNGALYQANGGLSGKYARKVWTTANTTGAMDTGINTAGLAISSNTSYTFSFWTRSSVAQVFNPYIEWWDSGWVKIGATPQGAGVTLSPNVWTRVSISGTSPATAIYASFVATPYSGAIAMPFGSTIDFDDVLVEASPAVLEYFDGSNPIQNLCTNPSFETTLGTWNMVSGGSISRDTTQGYIGTSSAKINVVNAVDGAYFAGGAATTSAGKVVTTSAWVKAPVGQSFRFDTDTSPDGSSWVVSNTTTHTATGDWQRVNHTTTMPAGATKVTVGFKSNAPWTGSIWVDAILIENGTTLTHYYAGTGDYTYAWTGTANASTSIQRASGVATWSAAASTVKPVQSTSIQSHGASSLMVLGSADGNRTTQSTFTASAGKTYTMSADMRHNAGTNRELRIDYTFQDSGGTRIGNYTAGPTVLVAGGSWGRRSTTTIIAPAGTATITCYPAMISGTAAETYWVDAFLLEESPVAQTYFDGTTSTSGDFTYAWTGAANASTSNQQAVVVAATAANRNNVGVYAASKFFVHQSTAEDGKKTAKWVSPAGTPDANWRIANINGSTALGWDVSRVKAGGIYTLMLQYRASGWSAGQNMAVNIADTTAANSVMNVMNASLAPSGWTQYRRTFQAARNATTASTIYMSLPVVAPVAADGVLEIRNWMLTEGEYTGDYIDGNSPLAKWEGTPNASTSIGYPPQLLDIAGKPSADITTTGLVVLPGGVDPTAPRTLYTVAYLYNDIPTGSLDVIGTYGDSAFTDTIPNNYMTLRYQSEAGNTSTVINRRTGGGGVQAVGVPVGVSVFCWGVRNQNLFVSHGGRSELVDTGNLMSVDHEAINMYTNTAQRVHIRTLIYLADHDAATRLAIQRYLGNKYGAVVA